MTYRASEQNPGRWFTLCGIGVTLLVSLSGAAYADEGGVSFWVPGFFGSLAATPQQPGWSLATIYYHTSVNAGADVAFARQVSSGRITTNFTGNLSARLDADADLGMVIPSYVFATPFLGGQAAAALVVPFGRNRVSVDATLTGSLGRSEEHTSELQSLRHLVCRLL